MFLYYFEVVLVMVIVMVIVMVLVLEVFSIDHWILSVLVRT